MGAKQKKTLELRLLGTLLTIFSLVLSFKSDKKIIFVIFLQASFLLITITLLQPRLLTPIYNLFIALGTAVGKFTQPIIMTVIFLALFIPINFFMRMIKKDLLNLKLPPQITTDTYWHNKEKFDPKNMPYRF